MGGCRCTFRNCPNKSSNSPKLHFFHFPLKDIERCEKWAQYSGNINFLSLPAATLRNKVVCDTHFHDHCFMNYKRDRLVQSAVPTLVRFRNNKVLDYEDSDTPQFTILEPTRSKHLIPPEEVEESIDEDNENSSTHARDEEEIPFTIETIEEEIIYEESDNSNGAIMNEELPAKKMRINFSDAKSTKPKILNTDAFKSKAKYGKSFRRASEKRQLRSPKHNKESTLVQRDVISLIEENENEIAVYTNDSIVCNLQLEELPFNPEAKVSNDSEDPSMKTINESIEQETNNSMYLEMIANQANEIQNLKQLVASSSSLATNTMSKDKHTTQVDTVTTSRKSENNNSQSNPSLTKQQYFNAIKKYLSPSMVALVRMEMFGGPDRPWKPDEQRVSADLLKLGDQIFDFVRDEWRFRLPPKKDVEKWVENISSHIDEDDI